MKLLAVHPSCLMYSKIYLRYEISPPPEWEQKIDRGALYVHAAGGRKARNIENATEAFVESTRMGADRA
jgi:hypothetical protein